MKAILWVFYCFFMTWFMSCKSVSDSKTGQGTISFYTGKIESIYLAKQQPWPMDNTVYEGYIYLKKIEISTTGEEWIILINEDESIPMHFKYDGELIRIPIEEKRVPVGEYHGLRISIEPKIKILNVGNLPPMDIILNQEPIAIYVRMGMSQLRSSVDSLEFTSLNGYLIPFTITEEEDTRIILQIIAAADGNEATQTINRWWTDIMARATKFVN